MSVRYFPYALTLQSPALVTDLAGDPNSAVTLPYIPGAAIRGAVARALGDPGHGALRAAEFHELVLSGAVRYLNAYPEIDGLRSLPAPVSLRSEKNVSGNDSDASDLFDLAAFHGYPDLVGERHGLWPEVALGGSGPRFVVRSGSATLRADVKQDSRIHQQRDRVRGRAWTEKHGGSEQAHGTIYTYDYLAADQTLRGVVLIEGSDEEIEHRFRRLRDLLGPALLLGRSRRSGYGGDARLRWDEQAQAQEVGRELRPVRVDLQSGQRFRALLLSPYLGRDQETGQHDPAWLERDVVAALDGRATVLARRLLITVAGGYNRKWGLELPQAAVVQAGSILLLEATAPIPRNDLETVEHRGLGERLVEGFGRLAFVEDAPTQQITVRSFESRWQPPELGSEPLLVQEMQRRILDERLARQLTAVATAAASAAEHLPTASLLNRLRQPLRLPAQQALRELRTWLTDDDLGLPAPARRQTERCRLVVGDTSRPVTLRHWLLEAVGDAPLDQSLPGSAFVLEPLLGTADTARAHLQSREPELRRQLIEATLTTLSRRKRREGREREDAGARG